MKSVEVAGVSKSPATRPLASCTVYASQRCMKPDWHPDELARHWAFSPDQRALLSNKTGAPADEHQLTQRMTQQADLAEMVVLARDFAEFVCTRQKPGQHILSTSAELSRLDVLWTPSMPCAPIRTAIIAARGRTAASDAGGPAGDTPQGIPGD